MKSRKSIRLSEYDYSKTGQYYVTICTQNRELLFGDIKNGKMVLNNVGKMVKNVRQTLPDKYPVKLDEFQIMPNHVHFIIRITGNTPRRGDPRGRPNQSGGHETQSGGHETRPYGNNDTTLGDIVGSFKSLTTNDYIRGVKQNGWKPFKKRIWQRNYWEHIIRTESDFNKICNYVKINPEIWDRDRNNPENNRINHGHQI